MGKTRKIEGTENQYFSEAATHDEKYDFKLYDALKTKNFLVFRSVIRGGVSISERNFYKIGKVFPFAISEVAKIYPSIAQTCVANLRKSHKYRDFAQFLELLQADPTAINTVGADGCTLFQKACRDGNIKLVKAIFDLINPQILQNECLTQSNFQGGYLIDPDYLDALINTPSPYFGGKKAIHFAIISGKSEVVDLLLRYSPQIDQVDAFGSSCFHYAVQMGRSGILEKLLQKAPNSPYIDATAGLNELCMAPLSLAVRTGDKQAVLLLLQHGANPNKINTNEKSYFYHASPLHVGAWYGGWDIVKILLEHGADPQLKSENGNTFLHAAAYQGHNRVIQLAIERGYDINVKNEEGCTPLFLAVEAGRANTVSLLIGAGARTDVVDHEGNTLLHSAVLNTCIREYSRLSAANHSDVRKEQKEKIDLSLIQRMLGYNHINCTNIAGETPLQQSLRVCDSNMNGTVFNYLLENGADPTCVFHEQLPSCITLMSESQWKQHSQVIRKRAITENASFSVTNKHAKSREKNVQTIFLNKFLNQYEKALAAKTKMGVEISRSTLRGHVRQLKTVEEFRALHKELALWENVIARLELLVKSRSLNFNEAMQQRVKDSRFIYGSIKGAVCSMMQGNGRRKRDAFIVVEDASGIQGIASFCIDSDVQVSYLMTHPRNLGIKISKRAVSNAATMLLQDISRRVLQSGGETLSLGSTRSSIHFYHRLGFEGGLIMKLKKEGMLALLEGAPIDRRLQ